MNDPEALSRLRQDIDGLTEQITLLVEALEVRHADLLSRFDALEAKIDETVEGIYESIGELHESGTASSEDVAEIRDLIEETNQEVASISETVNSIDEELQG